MTQPLTHLTHYLYCPICGTRYNKSQHSFTQTCHNCHYTLHENLRTATGALILQDNQVLLVLRAREPRKNTWDIPGGFVNPTEHPEEGLIREVKEELGVDCTIEKLFGVYAPNPYLYKGKYNYTCDLFYLATVKTTDFQPQDDISETRWFPLSKLPKEKNLAFPSTINVLNDLTKQFS